MPEPYDYAAPPEAQPQPQKSRSWVILAAVLAAVAACFVLVVVLMRHAAVPTDWNSFDAERISFLEERLHMDLSQAEPERYWVVTVAPDSDGQFRFTVADPAQFMQDCFFGAVLSCEEGSQYKCQPYPESPEERTQRTRFTVRFTPKGDGYEGDLVLFYE